MKTELLFVCWLGCALEEATAFSPQKALSTWRYHPGVNSKRFRASSSSAVNGDVSSSPTKTSQLLQEFAQDLSRLSGIRQNVPSADFSADTAIISAGSSYTRIWTHESWRKHRQSPPHARYTRHVLTWRFSTTAQKIFPACVLAATWAWIVSLVYGGNSKAPGLLKGGSAVISALTAPLALLLTLRTNASLTRLNESRAAWGRLVLYSRMLGAHLRTYVLPYQPEAAILAARHISIYGWVLKAFLRGESMESLQPVLQTMLPKDDYDWLSSHPRPTWGITSRLRQIVNAVKNSVTGDFWIAHSLLERGIGDLESIAGICERILGSPIPPTYSRHLSRVMTLWLSVLPLGLLGSGVPALGTILATAFIAYVMIGLDELGMELELPFPLLPLQQLASATQQGVVMQLTGTPEGSPNVEMPKVPL